MKCETHARYFARRGAFTLLEVLVVVLMIAVLLGIVLVGAQHARKYARSHADRTTVASLKTAVTQFQQNFGFLPPLVKESPDGLIGPLDPADSPPTKVLVIDDTIAKDQEVLRGEHESPNAPNWQTYPTRYSNSSLTFYLIGMLGKIDSDTVPAIDGLDGPGLREPLKDGQFKKTGRTYDAMFDVSRNPQALQTINDKEGRFSLRDNRGVPFRYYRWLKNTVSKYPGDPQANLKDMNVPFVVGDPIAQVELRGVTHAIVAAGPNGVFGDEPETELRDKLGDQSSDLAVLVQAARADNIVEVLR